MGFEMIYWTPISGSYVLKGCILEKCGNFGKNGRFSGRIRPDWGNTARADMAGLGSIGLKHFEELIVLYALFCFLPIQQYCFIFLKFYL